MFIACVLLGITLLVCAVQFSAFRRLYNYVDREMRRPPTNYAPHATVILPCKGLDPGFDDNVAKLLKQDYPRFEVIFAVASETDPAYQHLVDLAATAAIPVKIVVAGLNPKRAQKINNQLRALKELRPESEVLVFVDSDVIARSDFLSRLIQPLEEEKVGVATGYRFYISSVNNLPAQLRSLWNRMSAWEMANPRFAFAWGGAMAIRRETFEQAKVAAAWDQAADDDLSLTTAVKQLGLNVHFVPQCLVASEGDATIAEIFEWTNRQLILTKVYYPKLWARAISRAVVMATWLISMLVALSGWLMGGDQWMGIAVLCGLAVLPLELMFLVRARGLWQRVLSDNAGYIQESFWSSCAAIPLAHLVLPWLTLFSVATNRIRWRGVTYELRSPSETLVIS
jgi:cellulose synthase/poly-beta-1,6-N-acetylglucosamine synthase-like glycosyltransferase